MQWAAGTPGQEPPALRCREDTYRHVLHVGQRQLDVRSHRWRSFACTVLREFHEDMAGEPLGGDTLEGQVRANKLMYRLLSQHGALTTLRLIATALESGAGLGEGHEDDCLAVLKYAAAIGRNERSAGDWRRR